MPKDVRAALKRLDINGKCNTISDNGKARNINEKEKRNPAH